MHLKEVHLENFKSFRRIKIPFLPGFTAITGPNGSGKSNITDAVLFVLGPKSPKMIRAGRLTDLIFNGGESKQPAKYCKVSLVFDNYNNGMPLDQKEIMLTRLVKRAPLKDNPDNYYSYFYINGKPSSLQNFTHLLSAASISAERYNIIQQGDITTIVEMGNVPRRKIIDEIAGVADFDRDIEKAEGERAEVEENLSRINIILSEVKNQLRQLKKDRDGALHYKEIQENLHRSQALLSYKKQLEVEKEIAEVSKQITSYESQQKDFQEKIEKLRQKHGEKQTELETLEQKIAEVGGEEVRQLKEKIDAARTEVIKSKEQLNYYKQELIDLKKEKKEAQGALKKIQDELAQHQKTQQDLQRQHTSISKDLKEKEKELQNKRDELAHSDETAMELTRQLAKMKQEYESQKDSLHDLSLNHDRLSQKEESLSLTVAELEEQKKTYEFEIKDIDWRLSEIRKGELEQKKEHENREKHFFEKKKEEAAISGELQELEKKIFSLQRQLSKIQAEDTGGYIQSVQAILKARDENVLQGIHGSIAELADVDDKYRVAMETAAGSRMQAIIVENDETASQAIDYLRKNKLGRAMFLPLNKMILGKPRGKALLVIKSEEAHGFALDLVRYRERYKPAFWYVFGDTIIMENLDASRKHMGGVRLVTLQGDLIEASGAMIGGSVSSRVSFGITNRKKLEEMRESLRESTQRQEELTEQLLQVRTELSEMSSTTWKEEKPAEGGEALSVRKKEFMGKLKLVSDELAEKNKDLQALRDKIAGIASEIEKHESTLTKLDEARKEQGDRLLRRSKKEDMKLLESLRSLVEDLREQERTVHGEVETFLTKIDLVCEREKEIARTNEQIAGREKEYSSNIEGLETSYSDYKGELEALMKVEEKISGKVREFTQKRDSVYRELVGMETDIDTLSSKIETFHDLISRAKTRLPTLEDTHRELQGKVEGYSFKDEEIPSLDELKRAIGDMEKTLRDLEPVNMRALEDYEYQEERKARFDEDVNRLETQRKDLIKLVTEITTKKTGRFLDIFGQINNNFQEVYTQLSEGGKAELVLDNPDSPFEGGLVIKAKPKGKKVHYLSALSGGEKSMASLAFIFAIQNFDPSPFYILDEVDMFLDGKNAETVAQMLKQNSQNAQFIAVTLKKDVLQQANHVYGTVMQGLGVSNMIGNVDISKIEGVK